MGACERQEHRYPAEGHRGAPKKFRNRPSNPSYLGSLGDIKLVLVSSSGKDWISAADSTPLLTSVEVAGWTGCVADGPFRPRARRDGMFEVVVEVLGNTMQTLVLGKNEG